MTPDQLAKNMAKDDDVKIQAYAVAMIARGFADGDPATLKDGWPLETSVEAAIAYLNLPHTKKLHKLALKIAPTLPDYVLNKPARFAVLEEDPDAPDDGQVLVAGVLYDAETGEEA